ncbi:MAG: 3-hydroxyacyl-CoA dehydrogenase/enoyl-CoA hydratase family protein [Wenyingzhuangia sp.]|uniref:3-hydroxyacyl-CoA dehydrogenase/enoyl-CoA hydratase family protein n=1 Tax=Wenyingzhuangia sp. TaxID=1964193 RepID=UPI003219E934
MKKHINKIAVIGAGIMGSRIACHFANIGVQVLLLDISPKELTPSEKSEGKKLNHTSIRNRIVNNNLQKAIKTKPTPLYKSNFSSRITTGSLSFDIEKIQNVDWIIEVVVERLEIKQKVFDQIEKFRKPGTPITSNTSGIPIQFMNKDRSLDFREHFAVTHFFNPPRYLKLLEIVPGPDCKKEVVDFLVNFGSKFLGKTSILAKDTPGFIGNRIGIFGIMHMFHIVKELNLSIEEVDQLTGTLIGRPKSATFRTVDVVGLDTLLHVANGLYDNCKEDEAHHYFKVPNFIQDMIHQGWYGHKTGKGFYQKKRNPDGTHNILSLDLNTLEYKPTKKNNPGLLSKLNHMDCIADRFEILIQDKGKIGHFFRKSFAALFAYVANRIPEISDDLYKIDEAMKAGFGWQHGPFEIWDALGFEQGISLITSEGYTYPKWIEEFKNRGHFKFYDVTEGKKIVYDVLSKTKIEIPGQARFIILENIKKTKTVWSNEEASIQHLGNGVLNVEFHSKMNTLGSGVLQAINKGIDLAETEYDALILGNQSTNFSVGANLASVFLLATEKEYDKLNDAVTYFQNTVMRMRYSSCPTLITPRGLTLGGGCELSLHADKIIASAETYTGLVEFGVGLIPGGGGTKEMTKRVSDLVLKDDVKLNRMSAVFTNIALAKVSSSAHEAYDLGYHQPHKDLVTVNDYQQIATAKNYALQMLEDGYIAPTPQKIKALGQDVLGMFQVGADSMFAGNYATKHDKLIANKLGYVMAGGNLSEPSWVSEQYFLNLEREAFLSLLGEKKTLERIQYMLKFGKPLRN